MTPISAKYSSYDFHEDLEEVSFSNAALQALDLDGLPQVRRSTLHWGQYVDDSEVYKKNHSINLRKTPEETEDDGSWLTVIPRVAFVAIKFMPLLFVFGCASVLYESEHFEPKTITKFKTPIIFIHGSCSNRREFDLFRHFVSNENTGHTFSVNLNSSPLINDQDKNFHDYSKIIKNKVDEIFKLYKSLGYRVDRVILVGHSLGGVVAGQYTENKYLHPNVEVKAVISLNTPWHGSPLADKINPGNDYITNEMKTDSKALQKLRNRIKENGSINTYYCFSSTLDPIVPREYGLITRDPNHIKMSTIDDHYSVVTAPFTGESIREDWIIPNTDDLPVLF